MKKLFSVVYSILFVFLLVTVASPEIVVEEFFEWPDQLDQGGAVGIDAVEYNGEPLILVAAESNGVVLIGEGEEGDVVLLDSWADPDWSDSYGVDAFLIGEDLVVFFADGDNGLNVVSVNDEMGLDFVTNWPHPDDWAEAYAGRVSVIEYHEELYVFMTEEAVGTAMLMVDDLDDINLYGHWMDHLGGNAAYDVTAIEHNEELYIFVADEEIGLIALTLNDEQNLVELDRWTDWEDGCYGVAAMVFQDELLIALSVDMGAKLFSLDGNDEFVMEGEWWPDNEQSEPMFLDMVEFEDNFYVFLCNGWYGLEVLSDDDEGELVVVDHWEPENPGELIDVAYLRYEEVFYLAVTNLEEGVWILALPDLSYLPQIEVSTESLQFGEVYVSDHVTQTFMVRNLGDAALIISAVSLDHLDFSVDFEPEVIIAPGDSLEFWADFAPSDVGEITTTLTLYNNDQENDEYMIDLSGTGVQALGVSSDSLNFGMVEIGQSAELILTILNNGGSELNIFDIASSDEVFEPDYQGQNLQIEPAGFYELSVTFSPTEEGDIPGTLTIGSDLPEGTETTVHMSGTGWFDGVESQTDKALPDRFELAGIYPNPFNNLANVVVGLPVASHLKVSVYNILGEQVAVISEGAYNAGYQSFNFDGSGLSSGIYFVRAEATGKLNEIRKIVLMK